MSNDLARQLLGPDDGAPAVRLVFGTATALNTVTIAGSQTAVALKALSSVTAGDYCAVLESGAAKLILGKVDRLVAPAPGAQRIIAATTVPTTNAAGFFTVSFGVTFGAAPIVTACNGDTGTAMIIGVDHASTTTTTWQGRAWNHDGTVIASQLVRVQWAATGVW